jgi:hypothetical protein
VDALVVSLLDRLRASRRIISSRGGIVMASCPTPAAAECAAADVAVRVDVGHACVAVYRPWQRYDANRTDAVTGGLPMTLLRAHVGGGLNGLVAGLGLLTAFALAQAAPVTSSPGASVIGFGIVGLMIGSLVSGVLVVHPTALRLGDEVSAALARGRSVVVVRTYSPQESAHVEAVLAAAGVRTSRFPC